MTSLLERLPGPVRHAPDKIFPRHASFLLGEIALLSFAVLVVTGIYLTWFYDASGELTVYDGSYEPMQGVEVSRAYASVLDITFDRPFGSIIRQTHHWAALVFVAALVLHAMRVFFTGAFRRPRRANWLVGLVLMGLAMANGFFGLSLPNDLLGGTGSRIGHAFAVSIPVIGPGVAEVLFAGEFGNPASLHRFWQLHVLVIPSLIILALSTHLGLVWMRTHTQFTDELTARNTVVGSRGWPDYASKTVGLALVVGSSLLAMGALVQIAPIWLYGPFDPAAATVPAQPDWYLGWVEGALRIIPNADVIIAGYEIPSPFFTGVLLPLLVFGVLAAWPFAEERLTGDHAEHHAAERPRDRPLRTALGVGGLAGLTVLLAGGSHDLQAFMLRVPIGNVTTVYRVLLVCVPVVAGLVTWVTCTALVRGEADDPGASGGGTEP
jgi:ubiquinol-cytochrome c reductase cytochrome b subunit